jgi:hypothetical protein
MNTLSTFTNEQLEAEINRRKIAATRPKVLKNIDWSDVIETTEDIIEEMWAGTWHDYNDDKDYVYESVMKAIYGNDIFNKINNVT